MARAFSSLMAVVLSLAVFAGLNHCVLEELFETPRHSAADTIPHNDHSCPSEDGNHRHGSLCSSAYSIVVKNDATGTSAEHAYPSLDLPSFALNAVRVAHELSPRLTSSESDAGDLARLLNSLTLAQNSPPLTA